MDFQGKTALITGAATGIGKATALLLAHQGALVTVADINAEAGQATVAEITAAGGHAQFVTCDVSNEDQIIAAIAKAADGSRLDVLVNNAGIGGNPTPIHETDNATWERVMKINLTAVFWGQKYAVRAMLADGKGGAIVNIASIAGLGAAISMNAYGVSKAGVIQLTQTGAVEVARYGIRINAVCPGWTETPIIDFMNESTRDKAIRMIPQGRLGQPNEVANLIAFLASDQASFITGVAYRVDGGIKS